MVAAKTLPMIANPAVEPIARCALRMPEAILTVRGDRAHRHTRCSGDAGPGGVPRNASAANVTTTARCSR